PTPAVARPATARPGAPAPAAPGAPAAPPRPAPPPPGGVPAQPTRRLGPPPVPGGGPAPSAPPPPKGPPPAAPPPQPTKPCAPRVGRAARSLAQVEWRARARGSRARARDPSLEAGESRNRKAADRTGGVLPRPSVALRGTCGWPSVERGMAHAAG